MRMMTGGNCEQVRPLVQQYLYERVEAAAEGLNETRKASRVVVEEAGKAKFWAAAAFIIAGGAMLAAMAAAFSLSSLCGDTLPTALVIVGLLCSQLRKDKVELLPCRYALMVGNWLQTRYEP